MEAPNCREASWKILLDFRAHPGDNSTIPIRMEKLMLQLIGGVPVTILRKSIKNMHLRVLPPDGRVQVTAPNHMPRAYIERFVLEKRDWIALQQTKLAARPAVTAPDFSDGQCVYLWGETYRLQLQSAQRARIVSLTDTQIILHLRPGDTSAQRETLLNEWYRAQLRAQIASRLPVWEKRLQLFCSGWQIKNMKTRWGTCNTATKKIWLNLQLVKQPPVCLDYVIAHELTHLRYPGHGADFKAFLTRVFPDWPAVRRQLNEHTYL